MGSGLQADMGVPIQNAPHNRECNPVIVPTGVGSRNGKGSPNPFGITCPYRPRIGLPVAGESTEANERRKRKSRASG